MYERDRKRGTRSITDVISRSSNTQTLMIKNARLYKLIAEKEMGTHTLEIIIKKPGLKVHTFTFG